MSSQLLTVLQLCLLALLYLFFLRVLRGVWTEIRGPARRSSPPPARVAAAPVPPGGGGAQLVVREPAPLAGRRFELTDELTIGRAAGCQVTLDDNYVSQIHARVFRRDGQVMIEDLGSTNGTSVNRVKVGPPTILNRGDRLQIGNVVLELV